ncbi:MAG: LysM peptidoglycan-binding domain-containing protein [Pseudobdellovibrio sp.]
MRLKSKLFSSTILKAIIVPLILINVFGCASTSLKNKADSPTPEYDKNGDLEQFRVEEAKKEESQEELVTIPVEVNEKVEMWIRYFQGRGRPHMERYLARSTRYEALMKKVLRDNKLPEDLFYIALIESGFSSRAYSHASAVGYWQFIRGTGKRYKLQINRMIDDRRDPVLATQAAADYFKDLYGIFNSWYLSMAAYNVGEGRVLRAVKKYKTRDFWELSENKKALPRETDNYVPKYIAAKLIAKNPDKYGFEGIDYMTPIEFDHLELTQPVNLRVMAEKMNINYEDFKDLNPKYKGEIAPLDGTKLSLRIPPGSSEVAMLAANDSIASIVDFVPDQDETQIYKVRSGDNLAKIARKFRTSVAYLREINDFSRKKRIRVGQKILVPDRTPLNDRPTKTKTTNSGKNKSQKKRMVASPNFYVVKKGDNLAKIAQKFSLSVTELSKANNLQRKTKLRAGTRLTIPR